MLISLFRRLANQRGAPGIDAVDEVIHQLEFFRPIGDRMGMAPGHHRPVIHRMMEARARHHQRIEMRHRQAHHHAVLLPDRAAGRGAVPVKMIALAPERGWRAERPAVDDISDVADHRGIENGVHRLLVIMAALEPAAQAVDVVDLK